MHFSLGPIIGQTVSQEEIFYVDSRRRIMAYGVSTGVPVSLRVFWLTAGNGNKSTVFNSYDVIGGYPALFVRGYIEARVYEGFSAQHQALKNYIEENYHRDT